MTSPRCQRSQWKHSLLILLALSGSAGTFLHAQDTTTTAGAAADTTRRSQDTTAAAGAPAQRPDTAVRQSGMRPDSLAPDSARQDTTTRPDTTGGRDTAAAQDTTASASPAPAPAAPVDSVLAAACQASGGEAPDLLTVIFRPTATAAEREAAARNVGGTLLMESRYQAPGAWYVQVPGSGINPLIADRLILQPTVAEVGATWCPS
jgi:hypothetical protein